MTDLNDPRLTAYALGEMTDDDRIAFEAELAASPADLTAANVQIESIRGLATAIAGELREELNDVVVGSPHRPIGRPLRRINRWVVAAAASVVIGGLVYALVPPSQKSTARYVANLRELGATQSAYANETHFDSGGTALYVASPLRSPRDNAYVDKPGQAAAKASLETENTAPLAQLQAGLANASDGNDPALPLAEVKREIADPTATNTNNTHIEASVRSAASESYATIADNPFLDPRIAPRSTFGIDVDTASYSNIRRFLESNHRPPADSVRIEELINYFPTSDAPPTDGRPFAVHMEVAACPWMPEHLLVRVAIKGKVVEKDARPPSNLVFLIDVSGSMDMPNKLPLVKRSLRKLVGQLGENDRVAIVVYAGTSGLVLPSTNAADKATILKAIDNLEAGGSTNGGQGIELAYATALEHLAKDGNGNSGSNRVILCTDGDFNVGVIDRNSLFNLIAEKAKAGVYLNVLGFGTGNVKDDTMEGLADKGNGQYGYIDTDREADKIFVEQLGGTLVTIAKDVKLQLEFNPATVKSYRLIGYENRVMAARDFNDDLKDSGDLGAGHNVVALYEIDPAHSGPASDPTTNATQLKYQHIATPIVPADANTTELLTLKLRYKKPDAPLEQGTSELIEMTLEDRADASGSSMSSEMKFDASVAQFGMLLRDSPNREQANWEMVRSLAHDGLGEDIGGHRSEFLNLIDLAQKTRP